MSVYAEAIEPESGYGRPPPSTWLLTCCVHVRGRSFVHVMTWLPPVCGSSSVHVADNQRLSIFGVVIRERERERERERGEIGMAQTKAVETIAADRRNPTTTVDDVELADMVLRFFEDGEGPQESWGTGDENDDDDEGRSSGDEAERKAFWDEQHQLLKGVLYRTSSLESRVRRDTEQAVRESRAEGPVCVCPKPVTGGCRNCLRRHVSDRLMKAGYDSAICRSKWRRSPDIPSGEHTYIDVIGTTSKKSTVRIIVELDFRAEFEMARASPEYNKLIGCLPQVFVGKADRMRTLIKILCGAAKKCTKENKMHMAPWRKRKYLEAKWVGTCDRVAHVPTISAGYSERQRKLRASMLTFDLLEKMPSLHRTAVEVV